MLIKSFYFLIIAILTNLMKHLTVIFNFPFPVDKWCWTFSHMPVGHFSTFFGKIFFKFLLLLEIRLLTLLSFGFWIEWMLCVSWILDSSTYTVLSYFLSFLFLFPLLGRNAFVQCSVPCDYSCLCHLYFTLIFMNRLKPISRDIIPYFVIGLLWFQILYLSIEPILYWLLGGVKQKSNFILFHVDMLL